MTGSTQMHHFAQALIDYANGKKPEKYKGKVTQDIALEILRVVPQDWGLDQWKVYGTYRMIHRQQTALSAFGVEFDTWSQESQLFNPSPLARILAEGLAYRVSPITDEPICGNCATVLTPYPDADIANGTGSCYPCPLCSELHLFKNQ